MKKLHLNKGTIFDMPKNRYEAICITTNAIVKHGDVAVMDTDIAKAACEKYPGIDYRLGKALRTHGNCVYNISGQWKSNEKRPHVIFSFPTKFSCNDSPCIETIKESVSQLKYMCDVYGITTCYLPPLCSKDDDPDWKTVEKVLKSILDDRFIIVTSTERA